MPNTRRLFLTGAAAGLTLPSRHIAAQSTPTPTRGGTLNYLIVPEPSTLNCFNTTEGPAIQASTKVLEGLLTYDFDLNPQPALATAWTISEDGMEYRFTLRQNVKWHDGAPFTADDAAFSLTLLKSIHPRGRTTFTNLKEARVVDDYTLAVSLTKPAPYLLYALAGAESPIVPRHIYDGKGDPLSNPANRAPIGTGPFVFKEWVIGSHIRYVRNPAYWDSPRPYLDALVVRDIPDEAARAIAFETGEVDIGGVTPVGPPDVDRLSKLPHLGIEPRGNEYGPTIYGIEFNLDNPYLANLKVRQAIAHAIDPAVVLNVAWYGLGDTTRSIVSPTLKRFYNPQTKTYAFDPKKAEQLLEEAGFPRKDGARFKLIHDYQPFGGGFKRTGDYIKSALSRVGIEVSVRSQDWPAYLKRVYTDRDFDFTNHPFTNMFDPTVGLARFFISASFRKGVAFTNGSHYSSPDMDETFAAIAVETDVAKRKGLIDHFQDLVAEDLPVIPLMLSRSLTIYNRKVINHTVDALGVSGNFAGVWVKT